MKKETALIRAYRAVIRGTTNGECIHKLGLGSVYRTRISDLRIMMAEKYGHHRDWIPGRMVEKTEQGTVWAWRLIIPDNCADPRDPLLLLSLPVEKKSFDVGADVVFNQTEMFKRGGDHGQDEGQEGTHQEGAGNQISAAE